MLECPTNEPTYGASIGWLSCVFTHCASFPSLSGFAPISSLPTPVGEKAAFRCDNNNHVMEPDGGVLELTCNTADGTFTVPGTLPVCR